MTQASRLIKKWGRRLLDMKNRAALWTRRALGRGKADRVAVVASTRAWPIHSHTFVYQEMLGLTHLGLDVRLFYWEQNSASELQPAFSWLAKHSVRLQPVRQTHVRDMEYFEKKKPGRLKALLERVAEATGKPVPELEKEWLVLQACTFARMAELAGVRYLHTYFFYDQSFMSMVAAWLLEVPRGVTCYADHMLNDHAFKLVPLHLELADVVVATSNRIRRELSEKSGGRHDDKIVVKPNGVDGARFPPIVRAERRATDPFEVISVSRIEPKKGLTYLVEAAAELRKRGHRVLVHVVGAHDPQNSSDRDYATALTKLVAELGLGEVVVMHGMKMQADILPLLNRSRAFVAPYVELPSGDKDGIPTAMLEALASNLPIVTTNAGSIPEVVTDDEEALVVPQRDAVALADALERLIREPQLERRLAKAARDRFDKQFEVGVTEQVFHRRVAELLKAPR